MGRGRRKRPLEVRAVRDDLDRYLENKAGRLREALEGTWKAEHLFALRQAYELWQFYQKKITECDQVILLLRRRD